MLLLLRNSGAPPPTTDFKGLILVTSLAVRLDVRREVDSGIASVLAADSGGTTVNFNKSFKDVDGITLGVNSTTDQRAIYDFTDIPNPTSFKILLFNAAGTRIDGEVRWMARGIV